MVLKKVALVVGVLFILMVLLYPYLFLINNYSSTHYVLSVESENWSDGWGEDRLIVPVPVKDGVLFDRVFNESHGEYSSPLVYGEGERSVIETEYGKMMEVVFKSNYRVLGTYTNLNYNIHILDPINHSTIFHPIENVSLVAEDGGNRKHYPPHFRSHKSWEGGYLEEGQKVWRYDSWVYRDTKANLTLKMEWESYSETSGWRELFGIVTGYGSGHYTVSCNTEIPKGEGWVKVKMTVDSVNELA